MPGESLFGVCFAPHLRVQSQANFLCFISRMMRPQHHEFKILQPQRATTLLRMTLLPQRSQFQYRLSENVKKFPDHLRRMTRRGCSNLYERPGNTYDLSRTSTILTTMFRSQKDATLIAVPGSEQSLRGMVGTRKVSRRAYN